MTAPAPLLARSAAAHREAAGVLARIAELKGGDAMLRDVAEAYLALARECEAEAWRHDGTRKAVLPPGAA